MAILWLLGGSSSPLAAHRAPGVLSVVKQAKPDPVPAGARLTYTIRVTNSGNADLQITITDTLPLSITPAQTPGGTAFVPGGQVTWSVNVTAPDGLWTASFVVTVAAGHAGPLTNVVRVTTHGGGSDVYTATSTAIVVHETYLPLVAKQTPLITTVTGEYLLVRQPCTSDPCLPGLVHAVLADGVYHYLTAGGSWLWWGDSWQGYAPQVGEWVVVEGYAKEMTDAFGASFYDLEAVSLGLALPPLTPKGKVIIKDVIASGTGYEEADAYVKIRNDDPHVVALRDWTLRNSRDQVFTFPDYLTQPGDVCFVYTNEDHPELCGFSFGSELDVWDDANDCAYLRDDAGTLFDSHCYCGGPIPRMTISATATTLGVGEWITVTEELVNYGCIAMGLPQYRLYLRSEESEPILAPDSPAPVVHYLGIGPGDADAQDFVLQAVGAGEAVLFGTASYEVHLGYRVPAYWGSSSTGPITVTVVP